MYDLLEKLEALIEKWENTPYTGDLTNATRSLCAQELRKVIGQRELIWYQDESSSDARLQKGFYVESPF